LIDVVAGSVLAVVPKLDALASLRRSMSARVESFDRPPRRELDMLQATKVLDAEILALDPAFIDNVG
jgi:hypothetical protein